MAAKTGKKRWWKWLILGPLALVLIVQIYFFSQVLWYIKFNPGMTSMMSLQLAALREKNPNARIYQTWVPYEQISDNLKRAVIASEDANFTDHDGVDWEAIEKAYEKNAKKHKVVAGGSTITQQLAKNLFLSGQRSYLRKGQELAITYMLEFALDKRRILEIYLNVVEFGSGIFGAQAAAQHYYGIPAARLAPGQAAKLAVMLPRPRFFDKHRDSNYLAMRTAVIERRMNSAELP